MPETGCVVPGSAHGAHKAFQEIPMGGRIGESSKVVAQCIVGPALAGDTKFSEHKTSVQRMGMGDWHHSNGHQSACAGMF